MSDRPANEVFEEGARLLGENKHAEALERFEAILKSGHTSSDLEAYAGRAYVQSGKPGAGLPHLMNAVAMDRFDTAHRTDLQHAGTLVEGGMGTAMAHPAEWANRLASYLRPSESLALGSLCVLAILVPKALRKSLPKKAAYATATLALIFGTLSFFAYQSRSLGVLVEESELHAAPLPSSETLQRLPAGTRLRTIRVSGDFAEVERPSAFRGWIETSKIYRSPY